MSLKMGFESSIIIFAAAIMFLVFFAPSVLCHDPHNHTLSHHNSPTTRTITLEYFVGAHQTQFAQESLIVVEDAPWLRLAFDRNSKLENHARCQTILSGNCFLHRNAWLVISEFDNATQSLTHRTLHDWSFTSAYFNGNKIRIKLLQKGACSGTSFVSVVSATTQDVPMGSLSICSQIGTASSICWPLSHHLKDSRVPSQDNRLGRLLPMGCTAWIIDDTQHCLLTAGHCQPDSNTVLEFNVPLSTLQGLLVHPPPEDQYILDLVSIQSNSFYLTPHLSWH